MFLCLKETLFYFSGASREIFGRLLEGQYVFFKCLIGRMSNVCVN